jgi:acetamidase/formamidase
MTAMPQHHEIFPTADGVCWGFLSGSHKPILRIASGDSITIHTVSGDERDVPPLESGLRALPEQEALFQIEDRGPGPHILVGPIAVEEAEVGDSLAVEILEMSLRADWGFTRISPGRGSLPSEFPTEQRLLISLDRAAKIARLPWGVNLPTHPFFGIIATSPPAEWGRLSSVMPGAFGGNLDIKVLQPGAILYLPVLTKDALLLVGDGHAAQGDGEVCVTAIETGLTGTLRVTLRKNQTLEGPHIETASELIAIGLDEDLDKAALNALRSLLDLITARTTLSRSDAYMLCSLAADFHISQMVNVVKGVHARIAKTLLPPSEHPSIEMDAFNRSAGINAPSASLQGVFP